MSQLNNVISTTFRAYGGNVVSQLGQYASGMGRFGERINETTKMSERLDRQLKAVATTIRYAIAGSAVFGVARLVGQLRDVQTQMGLISAIGETMGGRQIQGRDLTDLMDQTRMGAVAAITPVKDYNDAVINLLSTVSNLPRDQITPIVTDISRAAQLAQVSAEDATKAFTTMNVAFGKQVNKANVHRMAQEFFILTREAPGGIAAGQQVIGQLGQLAQVTRAAHGTPEDMFALLLTTLRSGIPPSQAGRGLQYLIQTVAFPGQQVKASREALGSVGITPTTNMTLNQRLGRIFGKARRLGMTGDINKLSNLDEDTISELEASGDTAQGLSSLGIRGAGAQFLGTIFRRIHALRTALAIEGQIDVGQAQKDLATMGGVVQGHVSDINNLNKAWERFHKQAKLQEASVAINAMQLQVATIFAPVLNWAAGLAGGVNPKTGRATGLYGVMQRHQEGTRNVVLGGAAAIAGISLARGLGVGGAFRGLGRGFMGINAAQAAISGDSEFGHSPQNPLFVYVVSDLFKGKGGVPAGGAASEAEKDVAKSGLWGKIKGWGSTGLGLGYKWASKVPRGARIAGMAAAAEAPAIPDMIRMLAGGEDLAGKKLHWDWGKFFTLRDMPTELNYRHLKRAQQMVPNATGVEGFRKGQLNGRAEVFMVLDINQNGKVTRKRVHFPVNMWENGRAPTTQGKNKTKRSH